jgi:Ca-activated chloride channel family protein
MSFATPMLLWALLLIPLAVAAYLLAQRRRIKYAARFTNLDLLTNVVDASPGRRRHLPAALAIAALAALLLALARPQTVVAVPRNESSVVLAMDSSISMTATDVAPSRLDAAKSAASDFLDGLPKRFRVGLVSFASSATVRQEPTDDRAAVRSSLAALQGDLGTALGDAILRSVELAPESTANSTTGDEPTFSVLLLSDGANSTGSDPLDAIEVAKQAGVAVYTIALGTQAGTVELTNDAGIPQTFAVPPDRDTLKQIAEETGGRFFDAPTEADLQAVYDQLGSQVAYEHRERELTALFAGAGAALLLLGGSLSVLWFGRIP